MAPGQPVVEKETHGISPKASVTPWSLPRVPRCSPCQIRVGGPQTPADPPRDPRLPLPWPAAHTPACSCEAVTASPSVHPRLSPGHWALEVPGSETPDASPEKAQGRLRGWTGAGR